MAKEIFCLPAFLACPPMRMLWVNGTGSIKVTVRLLCSTDNVKHRVNVMLQLVVRKSLKYVAGTFYGFIYISIVERETHKLAYVPLGSLQTSMSRVLKCVGRHDEVLITVLTLTLAESQWDGHLAGCLDAVAPERVWCYLYGCKWYLGYGITRLSLCHV